MSIKRKASKHIKNLASYAVTPTLTKEKFDVLIKMAEGFQSLAEKGYPGTIEFLNDFFNLMGERFHTDFNQDESERLKLQAAFLASLKNKEFYQKKLKQFTNRATINLNPAKPGRNESQLTLNIAKHLNQPKATNKQKVQERLENLMQEAHQENARSRFDAIMVKFNGIYNDPEFIDNLDTNGIAFLATIEQAAFLLKQLDNGKRAANMVSQALLAREKSITEEIPPKMGVIMHIAAKILKHLIPKPINKQKHQIDRFIKAIVQYSPNGLMISNLSDKQPESSLLNQARNAWDNIQQLWNYLENPHDLAPANQVLDIPTLINTALLDTEKTIFSIFETTFKSLNHLKLKGLIQSKEWLTQIDKMQMLSIQLSSIEAAENALKLKVEVYDDSKENSETLLNLQTQKTELFKDIFTELQKIALFPNKDHNPHLSGLMEVTQYASSRINIFYYFLSAAAAGYQAFALNREQYQDPFTPQQSLPNQNTGMAAYLKNHLGNMLGNIALKEALQLGQKPYLHRVKMLDNFHFKLRQELQINPNEKLSTTVPLAPAPDLLTNIKVNMNELQSRIEIIGKEIQNETALKIAEAEQTEAEINNRWLLGRLYQRAVNGVDEIVNGNPHDFRIRQLEDELSACLDKLEPLSKMKTAISEANSLAPQEYQQLNILHGMLEKLKKLYLDPSHNPQTSALVNRQIHEHLTTIIKNLAWKNLGGKDKTHYDNQLKLGKATLVYLEVFGGHPKPKAIQRLCDNLKEKITKYEFIANSKHYFSEMMNKIAMHATADTDASIKGLYLTQQSRSFVLLRKIQFSSRKKDIQFLQKVMDNLYGSDNILEPNKAAILIGALNHLESELHSSFFSFGVNHFKHMIRKLKADAFKELRESSPGNYQMYKILEAGSQEAFSDFIKAHANQFKKFPTVHKLLVAEAKPLLHEFDPKPKSKKEFEHRTLKLPHKPKQTKNSG